MMLFLRYCWEIFNRRPKLTLGLIAVVLIIIVIAVKVSGSKNEPELIPVTTTTTPKIFSDTSSKVYPLSWTRYRCYPLSNGSNHKDHISCYNMRLNASHPFVKLITNIPAEMVKTIFLGGTSDLSGSQMHTLTSDICDTFPNLEEIEANNLGLEKIIDGAFNNCSKVVEIRLSNNSLTKFSTENWQRNKALKILHLDGNKLQNIDNKVLDATFPSLFDIALKRNNITEKRYKELEVAFNAVNVKMIE